MYEELIKKINPKPRFNLKWYKNEDLYSEGEIEDLLVDIIANHEPENYVEAIKKYFNWSVYYHLTHTRKNILNWYSFDKEASVLEIGCGLGAITNVLCENCKEVTAVELSRKRAVGALLRCREKENLEIIVGNLNDIKFEKKFDYITLIGVLEYQGSYTDTENPYADFLKKVKDLLKPEGKLLIAIENQYGLKYWCGAREDHTGLPFEGLNQYELSGKKVRTFSKAELDSLVKECGFEKTFFYYPMPDYKLPAVIYSQEVLPENENMLNMEYYYISNTHTLIAREKYIYKDIIENKVFDFFANSFLVECTQKGEVGEITFASLSSKRYPEYQVGTRFTKDKKVEKFALYKSFGEKHLAQIEKNEINMKKEGVNVLSSVYEDEKLISDYVEAPTVEEVLLKAYRDKNKERIYEIWSMVNREILKSSPESSWEKNIIYGLSIDILSGKEKYGPILTSAYLDMILRNAFYKDEKITWFDQEWVLENVPAKFVLFRAINQFYQSYEEAAEVLPMSVVAQKYDLLIVWKEFQRLEQLFINSVIDNVHFSEGSAFGGNPTRDVVNSIRRLLNE